MRRASLRLARRLAVMAEGYGVQAVTRHLLAVTQQELVLMIGISRPTTNEILKGMEVRRILRVQRGDGDCGLAGTQVAVDVVTRLWFCQGTKQTKL